MTKASQIIDRFYVDGAHTPLSNFWVGDSIATPPFGVGSADAYTYNWQTAEHYYQAAKFSAVPDIQYVAAAPSPGAAKRRGREKLGSFRPNWEAVKLDAMRQILALKFDLSRPKAQFLLDTGDALLVEGNDWGDRIWGCTKDEDGEYTVGSNWLGVLLMARRAELRAALLVPDQQRLDV